MLCSTESRLLSDDEKLIEKSIDEGSHSNNGNRTVISQKYPNTVKCTLTSTDKHENDHSSVLAVEKAEMEQTEKCRNDKTISNIDEETQNNSKRVSEPTEKLSEKPKRPKEKKRAFSLLDVLISVSIIGPLAIGFWRGVWVWMDVHEEWFPSWFCFTFGATLHIIFAFFKNQFHDVYMNKWAKLSSGKRLPYRALRILYTYTFGVACITHWRGGWIIIDDYLFMHIWITMSLTCLLTACLVSLRGVRNLIATPMIIFTDKPSCVFQFPTRYNVKQNTSM